MKHISRRIFTEVFKREAIKLVTEQHLNIAAAGRQLDVDPKSISAWMGYAKRGELKATLGASLRPRLPVLQRCISSIAGQLWHANDDES